MCRFLWLILSLLEIKDVNSPPAGPSGIAMVVRAVTHHLGMLVQQPLLSALRPLLHNFPQLLLHAAYSCTAETAAGLFGQLHYQVQQVGLTPHTS